MLKIFSLFAVLTAIVSTSIMAIADAPGAHPSYLHALTDLRTARWHLEERGGSDKLKDSDHKAIAKIDDCIGEIKKAAIDDGKDLNDHPKEDVGQDKQGHVHRARELLDGARKDIEQRESNDFAHGLKHRALHHLEEALKHVDKSLAIGK